MNERLEEIKEKTRSIAEPMLHIDWYDIKWLIEQAEILEKARKELDRDASMSYIFHKIEQLLDGEHNE